MRGGGGCFLAFALSHAASVLYRMIKIYPSKRPIAQCSVYLKCSLAGTGWLCAAARLEAVSFVEQPERLNPAAPSLQPRLFHAAVDQPVTTLADSGGLITQVSQKCRQWDVIYTAELIQEPIWPKIIYLKVLFCGPPKFPVRTACDVNYLINWLFIRQKSPKQHQVLPFTRQSENRTR